ncbi:sugar phosphate isomerase/epimerase family protein [Paenibacillus xerothermodurans]|uniref:Sugar phosphate isomerase/epimerase n=1 Tax=Paenibacillus xerothermodurans TaxID=1977292 RepID=A0A2W1P508_PAEXE|nr:sugar phosphate isomerase/epimerase [Paenibacillus xerothermodurans]PZE22248.1 sugar phosphate isomerase/epimerase [Paenibacillus xerothermodurans]
MKLATQDKPFFPESMEDKLRAVQSMGFEAFEIDGKLLVDRFDEVKEAVEKTGVPVITACGGYRGWIGHFEEDKREDAVRDISEILRHIGQIGGKGIVVPAAWGMFSKRLPPMQPPRSEEGDRRALLDSLGKLNQVAAETRTFVYLEPLNRYEDHMLNRLSDAVSIIQEGRFSNVKVTADFFHMNIEEPEITSSITRYKHYIGHVHIADSHRYQPGDGHLDFIPGFKALKEIGYEGYMAFECRVLAEDEEAAFRQSVLYIQACVKQASGT